VRSRIGATAGANIAAFDVNPRGQIVGSVQKQGGFAAVLWQDGVPIVLPSLGGNIDSPEGINARGDVVGSSQPANLGLHAVLWRGGEAIDLGTLGGDESAAKDINERGQIVGFSSTTSGDSRAFLWETGVLTELPGLGGPASIAYDIDESGHVAGSAQTAAPVSTHAVIWRVR